MDLTITDLTIEDISKVVRRELESFFADRQETKKEDEIGGIKLAVEITGLAKPTIYSLCSERKIPHSKKGKKLYFSRQELLEWISNGRRKTQDEIANDANDYLK